MVTVKPRARLYDEAVRQAVVVLWEASERICSKRLRPLLPILVSALEKHGHSKLDDAVRERVLGAKSPRHERPRMGPPSHQTQADAAEQRLR